MILSASRRTDIPAFFPAWFMEKVRRGGCVVKNPFNSNQTSRVSLAPKEVSAIVFWSKNPQPLIGHLDELDRRGFSYTFQYTLNDYGKEFEPGVPPFRNRLDTFHLLSQRLGPARVLWRYDPIILSSLTPVAFHAERFEKIAGQLKGNTNRVTVSLLDFYRKTERRLGALQKEGVQFERADGTEAAVKNLLLHLMHVAKKNGMEIFTCAEKNLSGIRPGRCVDGGLIRDLFGVPASTKKDCHQRPDCGCTESKDIGESGTCRHGCIYCYAG
jgi:hypothetical protein